MKINFGFDWDGTVTRAPEEFLAFAKSLMAAGHGVYVVTMRYASEAGEIESWREHVSGLIFSNRMAKEKACADQGIHIAVWIEDNPKAIYMDGEEIWGFVTPEGYIHSKPILETAEIESVFMVRTAQIDYYAGIGLFNEDHIDHGLTGHVRTYYQVSDEHCLVKTTINTELIKGVKAFSGRAPMIPVIVDGALKTLEAKTMASVDIIHEIHQVCGR